MIEVVDWSSEPCIFHFFPLFWVAQLYEKDRKFSSIRNAITEIHGL